MNDQKQTNTQEMLGSLRDMNRHMEVVSDVIPNGEELARAVDGIDGRLQRMSYHLKNISTCCTIIAAYVFIRCVYWAWLVLETVAYIPIE